MSYYTHHVFFCCNQREGGAACCNNHGALAMREYAKDKIKALNLAGPGKIRVNQAGCMDRCRKGPVIVVYPEAIWYTYSNKSDIDQIIDDHLQHNRVVDRLKIP